MPIKLDHEGMKVASTLRRATSLVAIMSNMPRWDIFCKVVDNYGDIGVCWRLARQLALEHPFNVRLWIDQLEAFVRLCPEICRWCDDFPAIDTADVVIEAFGCELPDRYVQAMVQRAVAPVWINLEYLSAEDWVEGCHRLPSLRTRGPLDKFFFFPGFTPCTGGLLRERDLLRQRAAFDSAAEAEFWDSLGIPPRSNNELRLSLFCYENVALPDMLRCWADGNEQITLLATPGPATEQIVDWFQATLAVSRFAAREQLQRSSFTVYPLPFLPQSQYDRLLWSCDVNFVRGEDSFVRAQWAQRPFVWQPYPQSEGTHLVKMKAFLDRYLQGFQRPDAVRPLWTAWNGSQEGRTDIPAAWADFCTQRAAIEQHGKAWANRLDQLGDLADNLVSFVREIYTGKWRT